jgi:hypothetical protein
MAYDPVAAAVVELALRVADNPPPVSRKAATRFRTLQNEAQALVRKAEALTRTWEAAPSRETAGTVRDAWLDAQRANKLAEDALAIARPGFSDEDGAAIKAASSDGAINAALRSFLDRAEITTRVRKDGRRGAATVVMFHYAGGGTIGLKYRPKDGRRASSEARLGGYTVADHKSDRDAGAGTGRPRTVRTGTGTKR